jgi:maltose O-acetyltransferase
MTEKEKMLHGELYDAEDAELTADRAVTEEALRRFQATGELSILKALLDGIGEGTRVRAPFFCDYGQNIFMGSKVFLNFGCVLLDVCRIEIGDGTQIGPGVQIIAADHPRDAEVRRRGLEYGKPVVIGRDVWIGGGSLILPGVTVGDNAVIGGASVVTRDVAAGVTVMGNPARGKGTVR